MDKITFNWLMDTRKKQLFESTQTMLPLKWKYVIFSLFSTLKFEKRD